MARGLLGILAIGLWGCLPDTPAAEIPTVADEAPGIRVQLVYGGAADLDLYVTNPMHETVYYGNNPAGTGGVLDRDQRCGSPEPRRETVHFANPAAGHYRVSVDYPERCRRARDPIPFLLVVDAEGERREHRREISLGDFNVGVVEFDVGNSGR